jgi:anaerobic selenocysteine-containing dehydrogenase
VFYGGTAYENFGGLGVQIATSADQGVTPAPGAVSLPDAPAAGNGKLLLVPVTRLYNRERTFAPSILMHGRIPEPYAEISVADAERLNVREGDVIAVAVEGLPVVRVRAVVSVATPEHALILPRHLTAAPVSLTPAFAAVSLAGELVVEG